MPPSTNNVQLLKPSIFEDQPLSHCSRVGQAVSKMHLLSSEHRHIKIYHPTSRPETRYQDAGGNARDAFELGFLRLVAAGFSIGHSNV